MNERELITQLKQAYWSAQTEKERSIASVVERGKTAHASHKNVQGHIQRAVEDIEHSMRMKLAAITIEYIHSNIE